MSAFWNFIVEYRVTVIATLMTLAYIVLRSYVIWREKNQRTNGWFYSLAVTALPFLSPNRPGGTGQLSSRVTKLEETLAPAVATFPKLAEIVDKLEPLLDRTTTTTPPTTSSTPTTLPPPDLRASELPTTPELVP